MNIICLRFTHRTFFDLILAVFKTLKRNGLSTKKMQLKLKLYSNILRRYGTRPTFFVTAKILSRHPEVIKQFSERGVEFGYHGYKHIDHTQLSYKRLSQYHKRRMRVDKQASDYFHQVL